MFRVVGSAVMAMYVNTLDSLKFRNVVSGLLAVAQSTAQCPQNAR